jgi:hypothetical protein
MIFHLPLKYFRVAVPGYSRLHINIPIAAQNQFSSIEYLIIYHRCTFNQLIDIISHTPRLSRLYCFNLIEPDDDDDNIKSELMIKLNNLTYLKMSLYNIDFNELEEFLLKLCSRLKLFNVKIQSMDENYLDADRWERFISQNMPSLNIFIFRYSDTIDDDFQMTDYHSLISCFTSSFWIDRKWIFKLLIEPKTKTHGRNRRDPVHFPRIPLELTGNTPEKNPKNFRPEYCFHFRCFSVGYDGFSASSIRLSNSPLRQGMNLST